MKKSIPIIRERESEAFILGNGREREFPLTPGCGGEYDRFLLDGDHGNDDHDVGGGGLLGL